MMIQDTHKTITVDHSFEVLPFLTSGVASSLASLGLPSSLLYKYKTTTNMMMDQYQTVIEELVSAGAVFNAETRVLSDVKYATVSPKQTLDIYFPLPPAAVQETEATEEEKEKDDSSNTNTTTTNNNKEPQPPPSFPIHVHIHGGGWSRGGKSSPFYGGPAVSQAAAKDGRIAVSIGYRLGRYPDFMEDCGEAIRWVKDHIEQLGGDLTKCFLSGHSAGGHISSLLILRHETFLQPYGIPYNFFKGLILLSGVYDLFNPLKKSPLDIKNKWFFLAYVYPAFGTDTQLRREASPLLLLHPEKETSLLGAAAMVVAKYLPVSLTSNTTDGASDDYFTGLVDSGGDVICKEEETEQEVEEEQEEEESVSISSPPPMNVAINTKHLPRILVINAYIDMGLQENGTLFSKALSEYTDCQHVIIPGTDHASICWNTESMNTVNSFIKSCLE